MQVQEITTIDQLAALRQEWRALWESCRHTTPFQTPEWLLPWWELFGSGRLAALAFYRPQRLAGLAPLFLDPAGTLRLVGEGISDYLDVLAEPECEQEVAQAVVAHLAGRSWDFADLPWSSPLLRVGASASAAGVCPVLELPASVEEWYCGLPAGLRSNLRRYGRRDGSIEIASAETLPEFLEALFRLHRDRWALRGGSGVLADARVREFHRRAAAGLVERGVLRLSGLRLEGRLGAVLYGFAAAGCTWFYLSGFEPAIARLSPGTRLLAAAIEDAIRAGLRRVDFLRGNERYKYRWGARDRANYRWRSAPARQAAPGAGSIKRF